MKVLMVSPYPPLRDGIAAYAVQEVARLLREGHDVEVLSPGPSAAHHHLDLHGPRGPLALAKRVRAYDKVVVQFHPDTFFRVPAGAGAHAATSAGLALAFKAARQSEVRVHEIDYSLGRVGPPVGPAYGAMWRSADRIVVHTEAERTAFLDAFPGVAADRVSVAAHGAAFVRRTALDRAGARARLGLDPEPFTFLSIGFLQPHKGFDRALAAYRALADSGLGPPRTRIEVVGSVRVEEPAYLAHVDELQATARATPGATVRPGYVSDEDFDTWLVAADALVLPYRFIWSSSVLERAALYGRPVIATRVGGLADQAPAGTVLVDDDAGLVRAMRDALSAAGGQPGADGEATSPAGPWPVDPLDRDRLQAEVAARAARSRGHVLVAAGPGEGGARAVTARSAAASLQAAAPLRRLAPLGVALPVSARPGASTLKKVVRRLTAWQVDPVVAHVNQLQRTLVDVTDALAANAAVPAGRDGDGTHDGEPTT